MVRGGQTFRLVTDQLGSVRFVVDSSTGEIAQEITYDPFGEVISDSAPGFQPFGFAGGLYSSKTGLTHFGAREFDAGLGRWTSSDPISFAGGDSNLYGYVLQDPVNLIDPSGLYGLGDLGYDLQNPGETWNAISGAAGETGETLADLATFWNTECSCGGQSAGQNFLDTNGFIPGLIAPTGVGGLAGSALSKKTGIPTPKTWIRDGGSIMKFPKVLGQAIRGTGAVTGAWLAGTAVGSVIRAHYGPCE